MRKLDVGIDGIEWATFAGANKSFYSAAFSARAKMDGVDLGDSEDVSNYFRAHIERGVASLRSLKSLEALVGLTDQMAKSKSTS